MKVQCRIPVQACSSIYVCVCLGIYVCMYVSVCVYLYVYVCVHYCVRFVLLSFPPFLFFLHNNIKILLSFHKFSVMSFSLFPCYFSTKIPTSPPFLITFFSPIFHSFLSSFSLPDFTLPNMSNFCHFYFYVQCLFVLNCHH